MKAIEILLEIIERQDWISFRSAALSNPAYFQAITKAIASCPECNGMTLLHAVVRCNPPLDVVGKMMEMCPYLPAAKDCLGRTPLHVAAGSAAAPRLIKLIAHAHPASCDAQDEDGKTPLHFACDITCELFEDSTPTEQAPREVCHDTIRALLSESIYASTIEDLDEMNAVEYAIMSDAPLKTIKLLQVASCRSFESSQLPIQSPIQMLSLTQRKRPVSTTPLRVSYKEDEIMWKTGMFSYRRRQNSYIRIID